MEQLQANGRMPQQQQQQQHNAMMRPQGGNVMQQVHARVLNTLRSNSAQFAGMWQATFDIRERAVRVVQLFTALRFLNGDFNKCLTIALSFENKSVVESQNKDQYSEKLRHKMQEVQNHRQIMVAQQRPMNPQQLQNGGMPNMDVGQMGGMDLQQQQQQQQQSMSHLSQPMRPSPLPNNNNNNTVNPSSLQQPQPPMPNMNQGNMPQMPNPNQNNREQLLINEARMRAQNMFNNMPEEQKTQMRNKYLQSMNEQQRENMAKNKQDPLMMYLFHSSRANLLKQRAMQNGANMQPNQNMMGGNGQQNQAAQNGGSFDFSSIMEQQQSALKGQMSGEQVVPASNNVNFNANGNNMARQMSNQPNINPQMLGQMSAGQPVQDQMQALMQQQEKSQRLQRQSMAAQQQNARQNQLRGQPGGLNAPNALNGGPAAQMNSPAMSMLTRPMVPPGQLAPGTPQPNRNAGMGPTPANQANQLAQQQQQQLLNQNNMQMGQGVLDPTQQQQSQLAMMNMLQLPQEMRDKLSGIPAAQADHILQQMAARNKQNMNPQQQQPQQPQQPQQNQQMNPQAQAGMSQLNAMQAMNQQNMLNGMGSAVPAFNTQAPPNQQQNFNAVQQFQRMQQMQGGPMLIQKAMDSRPVPPGLIRSMGMNEPQLPLNWGSLKQQIGADPQMVAKINGAQRQWFLQHPEESSAVMNTVNHVMVRMRQQQQFQGQNNGLANGLANAMPMPNGQAPPAQMLPLGNPMQAQDQMAGQNLNVGKAGGFGAGLVTQEEIDGVRLKFPNMASRSDDQLRAAIIQRKSQPHPNANMQQQQQMLQHQAQQAANASRMQNAQALQQADMSGGMPQRPPSNVPGQNQTGGLNQNQKRPQSTNDDVVEIPNPNIPANNAPQAASMQPNLSQQNPAMPMTKEDVAKMPPQERQAFLLRMARAQQQKQALKRAQEGMSQPPVQDLSQHPALGQLQPNLDPAMRNRIISIFGEVLKANPKGPAVQLDATNIANVRQLFAKLRLPLEKFSPSYVLFLQKPEYGGEARVRLLMKTKLLVYQNTFSDQSTQDYLSVTADQAQGQARIIAAFIEDMKQMSQLQRAQHSQRFPQGQPGNNQAQAQGQLRPPPNMTQNAPPAAAPMNRTASQQGHVRKASSSSRAPPAPTDNKPMDWAIQGIQSPHGVPKYENGRNELTPDKLKFPPQKKRRTGQPDSQASTPAAQTGTPGATSGTPQLVPAKVNTNDQARKTQQQIRLEMEQREALESKKFKCKDLLCEASIKGFETEAELTSHTEIAHGVVTNPLQFLLDNAATTLDVDQDGNPKPADKQSAKVQSQKTKPAPFSQAGVKKEGLAKADGATPSTPGLLSKNKTTTAPAVPADNDDPAKEKSLLESLCEKSGFELPLPSPSQEENLLDHDVSEADLLWQDLGTASLANTENFEDWTQFSNINDWGLRPEVESSPSLSTPSDSSRESDISVSDRMRINFAWDAFGNEDNYVPDGLMLGGLELGDAGTADGADPAKAAELNVDMDWSRDMSGGAGTWDTLFGRDTGMDGENNIAWDEFVQ